MTTLSPTLTNRRAMTLLFSLVIEGEAALDLFDQLPEREARELKGEATRLLEMPKEARVPFLLREMRRIRMQAEATNLGPVHEDWIVEALSRERPRVVGLLLGEMPEERRERILRALPEDRGGAAIAPGPEVPALVRQVALGRFEAAFVGAQDLRLVTRFDHLASLPSGDVREIVRGLGIDEMAVAYRGVSRDQLAQLLRSMIRRDEKDLIGRMKEHAEVDRRRVKRALRDVLGALEGGLQTTDLPRKVGLDRLARAMVPADAGWCRYVAQKLPRSEGEELLRRREAVAGTDLEDAGRLQRAAVEEARRLARAGRLPAAWAKVFAG